MQASFPNLHELELFSLKKVKKIWHSKEAAEYTTKLSKVKITCCENLEYVFPTSLPRNIPQLEVLKVKYCGVKEIVMGEEVDGVLVKFSFPKLSSLSLRKLEKLTCFYPGQHMIEFPKYKKLALRECEKMVDLFGFHKSNANDCAWQESQVL